MTKDDIILMADASGISFYGMGKDRDKFLHYLEAFADLVAAAKPWQGLTSEEMKHLYPYGRSIWGKETYEAIEKALKERNHG